MWFYIPASSKICQLKQVKYYLALSKISKNLEAFMIMMNCFCGMVDRRKVFSLISSQYHCQRFSPSRFIDTSRLFSFQRSQLRNELICFRKQDNSYFGTGSSSQVLLTEQFSTKQLSSLQKVIISPFQVICIVHNSSSSQAKYSW